MATCKGCGKKVGCGCHLDANGLCAQCRQIPKKPQSDVNTETKKVH